MKTVLAKDSDRLILHARRYLRSDQAATRAIRKLEAYLFREVRRALVAARPLAIRIRATAAAADGTLWAEVVFFDRATISDDAVDDARFLCKHDLKDAAAWTFRRAADRWESLGYPFDAFTDIHWPPERRMARAQTVGAGSAVTGPAPQGS